MAATMITIGFAAKLTIWLRNKVIEGDRIRAFVILILSTLLVVLPALATDYYSGWFWDKANHSVEWKNVGGRLLIPYAVKRSEIATLPFVAGRDAGSTAHQAIDDAAIRWSSVTWSHGLTHDDTTTSIYDNTIGVENLSSGVLAEVHPYRHCTFWFIICWSYDSHLIQAAMHINNDPNDVRWDYMADNPNTTPMTFDILRVALHELGHWVLLCDTYSGAAKIGNCTGVVRDDTVMTYYHFGNGYRYLFPHDKESLKSVYGG